MDFYGFFLVSFTNYSIEKSNSDLTTRTYKKVSNGNIQFLLKCRNSLQIASNRELILSFLGNPTFQLFEQIYGNLYKIKI
ncbi:hypothetical protein LEP1GSC005_0225 [Leptospira santarosai str. ST188]|nr:hypothetical protein LEP1GSC005_0225 [Leptospira santarosai str. ST188]